MHSNACTVHIYTSFCCLAGFILFGQTGTYTVAKKYTYTFFEGIYFTRFSSQRSEISHELVVFKVRQCGIVKLLIERLA